MFANSCMQQGDLTSAISSFNIAIRLKPDLPDAYNNLGTALMRQGDLTAAIALFKKAIELKPEHPDPHNNLGIILQKKGESDAAVASYKTAINLDPNNPDTYYNLGTALMQQGDLTAAISSFNKAIKFKNDFAGAYNNLAVGLQKHGKTKNAIDIYKIALKLRPDFPEAHNNIGNALKDCGNLPEAIASFKKAIELNPEYPDPYNNLAIILREKGELDAAVAFYKTAINLEPNNPNTYYNLGNALVEQGSPSKAISLYKAALKLKHDHSETNWNYSQAMLLLGNYKDGWEKYEWRSKIKNPSLPHANPICPRLDDKGLCDIDKLLIISEQGLGDTLHFMRYVIAIQQRGIHTSLCAQPKLHSLIQASGIDASPLTPEQANKVSNGYWIPLLSAPRLLEVSPNNPIITKPYIKTTDELNEKWRKILSKDLMPTIGINWRGNRVDSKKQVRNISTHSFSKLVQNNATNIVCLQRGAKASEIEEITLNSKTTPHQLDILRIANSEDPEDFLEYVAIIKNCDLVITTASTVAHIAAGIGIPTWVLLTRVPDWRWGLEGNSTFWYPSMRLFRQSENNNWDEVIERVKLALQQQFPDNSLDS